MDSFRLFQCFYDYCLSLGAACTDKMWTDLWEMDSHSYHVFDLLARLRHMPTAAAAAAAAAAATSTSPPVVPQVLGEEGVQEEPVGHQSSCAEAAVHGEERQPDSRARVPVANWKAMLTKYAEGMERR